MLVEERSPDPTAGKPARRIKRGEGRESRMSCRDTSGSAALTVLQDPEEESGSSPGRKTGPHSWGLGSTAGGVPLDRSGGRSWGGGVLT